jgi:hypothetical protein
MPNTNNRVLGLFAPNNVSTVNLKAWYRADQVTIPNDAFTAVSSPTNISGLGIWIDCNDTSNMTLAGSNITAIKNKVTNVSWSTTGNPVLTTSGGLNYATLSGANYFSTTTDSSAITLFNNNNTTTVFIVTSRTGGNSIPVFLGASAAAFSRAYKLFLQNGTSISYETIDDSGGSDQLLNSTSFVTSTNLTLYEWTDSGSHVDFTGNGQLQVLTNSGNYTGGTKTMDTITIGTFAASNSHQNFLTGTINEILVYNRVLTSTEQGQVRNYLANKWGLNVRSVSQLTDLSDNGYHLTQSTNYSQPYCESAGFNGRPSLLFDGVNDNLFTLGTMGSDLFGGDDKAQTVYIVFEYTSIPAGVNSCLMAAGSTANQSNYHWFGTNTLGNFSVLRQDPVIGQTVANLIFSGSTKYLYRQFFTGTTNSVSLNTNAPNNNVPMNNNTITVNTFSVGAWSTTVTQQYSPVRIAEIVIYDGRPSKVEDSLLGTYFSNRYKIQCRV